MAKRRLQSDDFDSPWTEVLQRYFGSFASASIEGNGPKDDVRQLFRLIDWIIDLAGETG